MHRQRNTRTQLSQAPSSTSRRRSKAWKPPPALDDDPESVDAMIDYADRHGLALMCLLMIGALANLDQIKAAIDCAILQRAARDGEQLN